MFADPNNRKRLAADGDVLLETQVSSIGRLAAAPKSRRYFQFTPLGHARGTMGNITWCAQQDSPDKRQQLIITLSGRVRLAIDTNGDGIREKADGSKISC